MAAILKPVIMQPNIYKLLTSILFLLNLTIVSAQIPSSKTNYSKEVEDLIRQTEENLLRVKYKIKDKPGTSLQERMSNYNIKGLTIAVINDYKIEWAKGYGWADVNEKRPVTPNTLFEPGSISKSLNAMGALKLVQENKIDLNADINNYLQSWKFPYDTTAHNKKITLAHLLSHTAGLGVHGFPGYFMGDSFPSIPQVLDGKRPANTQAVRSMWEPGLRYEYSGGGTMISQLIQMDLTHQAYDKYIYENVLKPIGMANSFYTQPPPFSKKQLLATGYRANGDEIKGKYPVLIEQAAGGLWTTPTDLCRYIIEMQLSAQGKSNKVLTKEMTQKMLTPYIDSNAALGVFIDNRNGTKYFQHSAGNQGFSGMYMGSMEGGKGIAVFINADYGFGIIEELLNSVGNAYKWKGIYKEEPLVEINEVVPPAKTLEKYEGLYKEKELITIVWISNNNLWYRAGGGLASQAHFTSDSSFINLEYRTEKGFSSGTDGKIKGLIKKMDGKETSRAEKIEVVTVPVTVLQRYVGKYDDGKGIAGEIILKENSLWLNGEGETKKIYFVSETDFLMAEDANAQYKFITDANGKTESIRIKVGDNEKIIKKLN